MPTQLKNFLLQLIDPKTLPPDELSGFLADFWALFLKLHSGVAKNEERLTSAELEKINGIIKELSDNFFPMAHSDEPLRMLAIVEKRKILDLENHVRILGDQLGRFADVAQHSWDVAQFSEEFSRNYRTQVGVAIQHTHEKIANLSDDVHL